MVAIKDMEMPSCCSECDSKGIRAINDCQLIFDGCANCGRHPNCPLIEIKPSEYCVSRQAIIDMTGLSDWFDSSNDYCNFVSDLCNLPLVTPTHGTCEDCKHQKDSDGVYRRGLGAESKCPLNIKEVYEGNFYCKGFERREKQ